MVTYINKIVGCVMLLCLGVGIGLWIGWEKESVRESKVGIAIPLYLEFDDEHEGYKVTEIVGVRITAYNNHKNQTNDQPNIGASNRKVYEGSIALSRDLLRDYKIKYGDVACVLKMKQCFIVEDTMNKRYDGVNGKRADIFMYSKNKALKINTLSTLRVFSQNRK